MQTITMNLTEAHDFQSFYDAEIVASQWQGLRAVSIFKRRRPVVQVPESNSTTGPTWGPWADHETRCQCSVCR